MRGRCDICCSVYPDASKLHPMIATCGYDFPVMVCKNCRDMATEGLPLARPNTMIRTPEPQFVGGRRVEL